MKTIKEMYSDFKYRTKCKLKTLLCSLDFHDWTYFNDGKSRICKNCDRTEEFNAYTYKYSKVKQLDWERRNEILY